MRLYPTSISAAMYCDRSFRSEDLAVIKQVVRTGDLVIDVGANVGTIAMLAASRVGPSGQVIAIEANPRVFAYLGSNLELNGMSWVETINAACSNQSCRLHISDQRLDDMNHISSKGPEIPAITLDSLKISRRARLLKIDTEGYDLHVLEGAESLLHRTDYVLTECSEWNLNRYGRTSAELLGFLRRYGFDLYRIVEYAGTILPIVDYDGRAGGNILAARAG
jgi:FkbM family methyltransferase